MTPILTPLLLLCGLISLAVYAEPVVKWQDAKGQWHFGTPATAPKQQRTHAVQIERPMSVVQNSHPLPTFVANPNTRSTRQHHTEASSAATQTMRSTQDCEQLRDNLKQRRKHEDHRAAQLYYEQQCVMGRYYGHSSD